jgi:hypothetical protein
MACRKEEKTFTTGVPLSVLHPQVRIIPSDSCKTFSIPPVSPYPSWTPEKLSQWIEDPTNLIRSWDAFPDTNSSAKDEEEFNIISRLLIVLGVVIVILGAGRWMTLLILLGLVILILLLTVVPTILEAKNGLVGLSPGERI